MRFSYEPNEGAISAYVSQSEFELAASGNEFRVFKRHFTPDSLKKFIQEYALFMKQVFEALIPDENMYDIVALSKYKKDYVWKSLLNLEYSKEHESFLENMLGYAIFEIDKEIKKKSTKDSLEVKISAEDATKLSIILNLLDLTSLPEPFNDTKKKVSKEKLDERKLKEINNKIAKFEKKYGFNTEEMLKYYSDDKFLDDNMQVWMKLNEDKVYLLKSKDRQLLIKDFVKKWSEMM